MTGNSTVELEVETVNTGVGGIVATVETVVLDVAVSVNTGEASGSGGIDALVEVTVTSAEGVLISAADPGTLVGTSVEPGTDLFASIA